MPASGYPLDCPEYKAGAPALVGYRGAPLLGVRGVCILGHGSSNDPAVMNGVRVAAEFARAGVNERLEREFSSRPGDEPPAAGSELPLQ